MSTKNNKQRTPPRLFVIFAKEALEAVIFRKGPTTWFHIIRWDTKNDKFYSGAWIKGRIYPEKCDLSPDGELLLYFIHQGRRLRTEYKDSYNAISRSPWLEAIGLWSQGTTYGGGGRFTDNKSVIIRFYPVAPHPQHLGTGLNINFLANSKLVPLHSSMGEYEGAEWSGRDQRGRLVYTSAGKLMLAGKNSNAPVCLADFNDLTPDPQPAPTYASRPLGQKLTSKEIIARKKKP